MKRSDWSMAAALGTGLLGAPACCVCASTLVRTPSGPRRLGELQLGDEVLSLEVESGELVPARIIGARYAQRECMRISYPGGELVCTPDHPIYCPESGEYEPASRWVDGVRRSVLLVGEGPAAVDIVRTEAFVGMYEVVDITVDAPMHNFVAGGLLVHNKSYVEMIYASYIEGPSFSLEPDDLARVFEIRACVEGRDPSGEAYGSSLEFDITSREDPASIEGNMRFVVQLQKNGRALWEGNGDPDGGDPYLRLQPMAGACLSPLSIAFDRVDDRSDGAIGFTWELSGATKPPAGTSLDDELVIEITEIVED